MITVYYTNPNSELLSYSSATDEDIYKRIVPKSWIYMVEPTDDEIKKVAQITGLNESMIRTACDEEESAHIDIDDDTTLVVMDTGVFKQDPAYPEINTYYTTPVGILFNANYYVTVSAKPDLLIPNMVTKYVKNISTYKHIRLTIQIMYRNATNFVYMAKLLDKDSEYVQNKLHESLANTEIFELMNLGKSLVYLSTGLNADILVLEKIKRLESFKQYEEDLELIDDAVVENRQALEMCSIHRDVLNGTMDAYASVINNNVNSLMKTLTVVTIVLSIPTLVASFFGMNFDLPIAEDGFTIAVILGISLSALCGYILLRYTSSIKGRKIKK